MYLARPFAVQLLPTSTSTSWAIPLLLPLPPTTMALATLGITWHPAKLQLAVVVLLVVVVVLVLLRATAHAARAAALLRLSTVVAQGRRWVPSVAWRQRLRLTHNLPRRWVYTANTPSTVHLCVCLCISLQQRVWQRCRDVRACVAKPFHNDASCQAWLGPCSQTQHTAGWFWFCYVPVRKLPTMHVAVFCSVVAVAVLRLRGR